MHLRIILDGLTLVDGGVDWRQFSTTYDIKRAKSTSTSTSAIIIYFTTIVYLKSGIGVLASIVIGWNVGKKDLLMLILSHSLMIIDFMAFTSIGQILDFMLPILKSTIGSWPSSIQSLIVWQVHELKWTLNACLSGFCKMTFMDYGSIM